MEGGQFNIRFGDVTQSQFVTGDYNTVAQQVGLSPQDVEALRAAFADMRAQVAAGAPPELREQAAEQALEVERAVVSDEPDPGRARRALRWFREHLPQLAGTVASVLVNPIVGKVVETAGDAVAKEFREAIE